MASPKKLIRGRFPKLGIADFKLTSPETDDYNCIGWAAGVNHQFWWPSDDYYWPSEAPRVESIEAFIAAFATVGYVRSADATLKEGFEKIAIYVGSSGKPTHAARLLADGRWTSKLGPYKDISHRTLFGLEGGEYGTVSVFMERALPA